MAKNKCPTYGVGFVVYKVKNPPTIPHHSPEVGSGA